ncbi:carboxymuconolactone decarboxylase family protein [Paraburkholderia sp. RL18-103-BIB-C]|uniref:carboxymuconolactone decarboxylase family protein n=1 Tax=unclassified Paraburkholderia TaxID=2615204 RepID=UPI0038B73D49
MSNIAQLSLHPRTLDTAEGRAKEVLENAFRQTVDISNMHAAMPNSPALLDTYLHGYNLFRKESSLTRVEQELVFLVISRVNECTYCMATHSMIADVISRTPAQTVNAIRADGMIDDPKLRALAEFTRTMVVSRGRPSEEDLDAFQAAGYTEQNVLDIILAIAVKTISNYTNHLFHTDVDELLKVCAWISPAPERREPTS